MLDSCRISKRLSSQFIKDRPVSSLGVFVFEFLGASFSSALFSIGALFLSFGCFMLRSSFSSASFSKLPPLLALIDSHVSDFFFTHNKKLLHVCVYFYDLGDHESTFCKLKIALLDLLSYIKDFVI